jgi:DNA modification methylase
MATVSDVLAARSRWSLDESDAVAWMRGLPDACLDAIVTDPPYPEIDREYGRLSEADWRTLMDAICTEARRVIKPRGSMVAILQPNSERVGRMRSWLWHFMADWSDRWGVVQDAWWWNHTATPTVHAHRTRGLMRPSVKACVWLGNPDCYRDQTAVLWTETEGNESARQEGRALHKMPGGLTIRRERCGMAALERGGVTPYNLLPIANADSGTSAGSEGHGAGTPYDLAAWWTRYLCPEGGVCADPFTGSGTMGMAALRQGRRFVGCEGFARYVPIARRRCAAAERQQVLPLAPAPRPRPVEALALPGTEEGVR